jgi:predicted nuclease of predicted toxin-antitoxin system
MKFIIDAQLPRSLAAFFNANGHDAIHTFDLPNGSNSTDSEINVMSISELRVVVTKDGDFHNSFTAKKEPHKLLHVKTGNISNKELIKLFQNNLPAIVRDLEESDVVTIDQRHIIALS